MDELHSMLKETNFLKCNCVDKSIDLKVGKFHMLPLVISCQRKIMRKILRFMASPYLLICTGSYWKNI